MTSQLPPNPSGQYDQRDQTVLGNQYNTVIVSPSEEPVHVDVPNAVDNFVGREAAFHQLIKNLCHGEKRRYAITGMPGIGKSELAAQIAYSSAILKHFTDGVLWARVGSNGDVRQQFLRWGKYLNVNMEGIVDLALLSQSLRNAIGQRHFLFILDDLWEEKSADLLCCGGPQCKYLITTRHESLAQSLAEDRVTKLHSLDTRSAVKLLPSIVPSLYRPALGVERSLLRSASGLPLAIKLIGGQLKNQLPLHDLPIKSLNDIISLSLADLPGPIAQSFYDLGAFAPLPAGFSPDAAEVVACATNSSLKIFRDRHLLETGQNGVLTIHQVLADFARTQTSDAAYARHMTYYTANLSLSPDKVDYDMTTFEQLRWAWRHWFEQQPVMLQTESLITYMELIGRFVDDRSHLSQIRQMLIRHISQVDPHRTKAQIYVYLAIICSKLEIAAEAISAYQSAQVILEREQQASSFTLDDYRLLARTYLGLGNWTSMVVEPSDQVVAKDTSQYQELTKAIHLYRYGLISACTYGQDAGLEISLYIELIHTYARLGDWSPIANQLQSALAALERLHTPQIKIIYQAQLLEVDSQSHFIHGNSLTGAAALTEYQHAYTIVARELELLTTSFNDSEYALLAHLNAGDYQWAMRKHLLDKTDAEESAHLH
ncbi:MAG: NB-ARC domain-containing protein [Caldilineaceae bacterium]